MLDDSILIINQRQSGHKVQSAFYHVFRFVRIFIAISQEKSIASLAPLAPLASKKETRFFAKDAISQGDLTLHHYRSIHMKSNTLSNQILDFQNNLFQHFRF